jgi:cytochrome P450
VHRPDVSRGYRRRAMTTIERETSTAVAKLPPGPPFPRAVQGALALANRRIALQILRRVYGSAFTIDVPIFGQLVVISDPNDIRRLFKTAPHMADTTDTNLGRVMGPNSMFALTGDRHRAQRKLLTPSFNGSRLSAYEVIIEREAVDEFATWPSDQSFATMPSMMRITLNVILRAVFGAEGQELERLREILPPGIRLGSKLALIPVPQWDCGRWSAGSSSTAVSTTRSLSNSSTRHWLIPAWVSAMTSWRSCCEAATRTVHR